MEPIFGQSVDDNEKHGGATVVVSSPIHGCKFTNAIDFEEVLCHEVARHVSYMCHSCAIHVPYMCHTCVTCVIHVGTSMCFIHPSIVTTIHGKPALHVQTSNN